MTDTGAQERMSSALSPRDKLVAMLRNTLRSYPLARLHRGRDAFGASLGEDTWIRIRWSGHLTDTELRDLLALFATWLVVDPGALHENSDDGTAGHSALASEARYLSSGRQVSRGSL
jgi:hypothetical protein